jgi:hypothetical protein
VAVDVVEGDLAELCAAWETLLLAVPALLVAVPLLVPLLVVGAAFPAVVAPLPVRLLTNARISVGSTFTASPSYGVQ